MSTKQPQKTETETGVDLNADENDRPYWLEDEDLEAASVSVQEWAAYYDLLHELLPFKHREMCPIEALLEVRDHLEKIPPTAATWRYRDIDESRMNFDGFVYKDEIALVTGSYPIDGFDSNGTQYMNPNYVHLKNTQPTFTETQKRFEVLDEFVHWGLLSLADVAPYFGYERGGMCKFACKSGYEWGEKRDAGIRRFGRTIEAIHDWSDYTYETLAYAFGVPESTLYDWLPRNRGEEFEIPPDPAPEKWLKSGHMYRARQNTAETDDWH